MHVPIKRVHGGEEKAGTGDICGDQCPMSQNVGIEEKQRERGESGHVTEHRVGGPVQQQREP